MPSSSYYERVFGIKMKGDSPDQCARITDVPRFVNMAWWFWSTPNLQSSVFHRPGLHQKVWTYILIGNVAFIANTLSPENLEAFDVFSTASSVHLMSFSGKLLTFVLSAYLIQIITVYYKSVRSKARRMNYGCSKVVDILSVTLDYHHVRSTDCRSDIHRALTCIGHYALHITSGATGDVKNKMWAECGFNGEYLSTLPPKQALHVLRLAILQTILKEKGSDGCFSNLTDNDWEQLRMFLNDYCGGASQVSSSVSSSKLPHAYTSLIHWAVKTLAFFYVVTFYSVTSETWSAQPVVTVGMSMYLVWFNLFMLMILYFLFGVLEVYVAVNDTWHSGLVLKNYHGIIELICQPLDKATAPLDVQELSCKYKSSSA